MNQPYNAAFDADGVILNFHDEFKKSAEHIIQRPILHQSSSYSLEKRFQLTKDELDATWKHFNQTNAWARIEPLPGALEAIEKIRKMNDFHIHVVTAIPDEYRESRKTNFKKIGFHPHDIHCVLHINRYSKVPPIQKLNPVMFIDDRIEHLHSNQSVPILVHIDHGDEQFPDPQARVDYTTSSLLDWAHNFEAYYDTWMNKVHSDQTHFNFQSSTTPRIKRKTP